MIIIKFVRDEMGKFIFDQYDELTQFIKEAYPIDSRDQEFLNFAIADTVKVLNYIKSRFMKNVDLTLEFDSKSSRFRVIYMDVFNSFLSETITRKFEWYVGDGRNIPN